MNQSEIDRRIYEIAKEYLMQLDIPKLTPELLEKYLHQAEVKPRPDSISQIYQRLLESAQNANMMSGVIGKAIGGVYRLGAVLCDFEPFKVLAKYTKGWEQVLTEIETKIQPNGKIRRTSKSIWPRYSKTILSAAQFITQFSSADEFYQWVDFFDGEDKRRAALPLLLDKEITGFGFALACDFLKELGYINFAKPDVHLREIFINLHLCSSNADDYEVFKAIVRVAHNAQVTPYNADKLFWLIGSGYFYDDEQIGEGGKIGSRKAEFIAYAQEKLL